MRSARLVPWFLQGRRLFWLAYWSYWSISIAFRLLGQLSRVSTVPWQRVIANILLDSALISLLCAAFVQLLLTRGARLRGAWRWTAAFAAGFGGILLLHSILFVLVDAWFWRSLGPAFSSMAALGRVRGIAGESPALFGEGLRLSLFWGIPQVFQALFITVAAAYLLEHARNAREQELATSRLRATLLLARLQNLRSQLEPHFLFNALTAVQSLVRTDPPRAEAMLGRIGRLLRTTLQQRDTPFVTLREELEVLDLYLDIEGIRFEDRLHVVRAIDAGALEAGLPHLLLQPLVENAIRHGVARMAGGVTVGISAQREGGALHLEVWDSGPGLQMAIREGVGLTNTRERLRHVYGTAGHFTLCDRPEGGTRALLELPFECVEALRARMPIDTDEPKPTMGAGGG